MINLNIEAPLDVKERARDLLRAFLVHEGMVSVHVGKVNGDAAVVIDLDAEHHILFAGEAIEFADGLEATMREYPTFDGNSTVADLIMMLRQSAGEAESACQVLSTS